MTCACGNCEACNKEWLDRAPTGNTRFKLDHEQHDHLRDQIAIAAMQGIIMKHGTYDEVSVSVSAYAFADAMMKERVL